MCRTSRVQRGLARRPCPRRTRTHFHLLFSMQTSSFIPCSSYLRQSTRCVRGPYPYFFGFVFLQGLCPKTSIYFLSYLSSPGFCHRPVCERKRKVAKGNVKNLERKKKNRTHLPRAFIQSTDFSDMRPVHPFLLVRAPRSRKYAPEARGSLPVVMSQKTPGVLTPCFVFFVPFQTCGR